MSSGNHGDHDIMERHEVTDILEPRTGEGTPLGVPVRRVEGRYTTAMQVQVPRALTTVEKRAMQEATLLGPDAYYAWGAGKDRIEGPSKELAMALARCYGNCALDMDEVQETAEAWIFTASFIDLETGFTMTRQFRQSKKWVIYGKFDEARKEDIRFQIGQSKAIRNVILNAMPGWLVSRALDRAKGGVREAIEKSIAKSGMAGVVEFMFKKLAGVGVEQDRVLNVMGRSLPGAITIEDLVILQGNIAAINSGAETAADLFPTAPTGAAAQLGNQLKNMKGKEIAGDGPTAETTPAEAERKAQLAKDAQGLKAGTAPQGTGNPAPAAKAAPTTSTPGQMSPGEAQAIQLIERLVAYAGVGEARAKSRLKEFVAKLFEGKTPETLDADELAQVQKYIDDDAVIKKSK